MVPLGQVILFVGSLLLAQFADYLTIHINHLGLNVSPTIEIIKCYFTVI